MTHAEKIEWMHRWADKHGMQLTLEGECGIGRECVGVTVKGAYPDYADYHGQWDKGFPRVWTPEDAYHKHACVAVLGRGEAAEEQLYQWLKWFDDRNYKLEVGSVDLSHESGFTRNIRIMLGQHLYRRLVPAAPQAAAAQPTKKKAAKKKTKKTVKSKGLRHAGK